MRLLVVDDEKDIRRILSAIARSVGYNTETASTLEEARQKNQTFQPDVVLLDMSLPDGSGINLLKEVKADRPDTKVMVISAYVGTDEQRMEGISQADTVIGKPFYSIDLKQKISAWFHR